jgi:hypothetical protein
MVCSSGKRTPHPLTSLAPMTSIKTISITAVSLAAGLCLLSVSGNAAQANPYNTFGDIGGCDSWSAGGFTPDIGGGFVSDHDCEDHREWASDGAQRSQQHSTQSQHIGQDGGLIGQISNGSHRSQQQETSRSSSELELIRQQQEIQLLKMKLQWQQQQQRPYGYQTVSNTYPPTVQPVYESPSYDHYQQTSYQPTRHPQHQPVYQQPEYHQPQPSYHY